MNVDTGQFEVIMTEQVAALAAKVERLERREQAREDVAELITGGTPGLDALQIIYRAGRERVRTAPAACSASRHGGRPGSKWRRPTSVAMTPSENMG